MSRTAEFLASLNDCELSFLYAYKYTTYLPESQKLFDKELQKRRLHPLRIEDYIRKYQFNPGNISCPRCNSSKVLASTRCLICGYDVRLEEERKKSRFWKVMDVIGTVLGWFSH